MEVVAAQKLASGDKDRDGLLNMEELRQQEEEQGEPDANAQSEMEMRRYDKDNDGYLNKSEIKAWQMDKLSRKGDIVEIMKLADTDNDGHLSLSELLDHDEIASDRVHSFFSNW